jgi:hypothetical protein
VAQKTHLETTPREILSWQAAHSSRYQELCPVRRGFIAMSGSSDRSNQFADARQLAGGSHLASELETLFDILLILNILL